MSISRKARGFAVAATALTVIAGLSACSGAGGGGAGANPRALREIHKRKHSVSAGHLLKAHFQKDNPGIKVNFIQMEENDLRDAVTKDVATQGGQYDIVTVGAYEVPLWQKNGWLTDLSKYADKDPKYDVKDFFDPIRTAVSVDGDMYAIPFYGESSMLMYNKKIFADAGLTVPSNPTWQEVADLAKKVNTPDHAGICLRGKPGWGEGAASLTTVLNTFGGAWFDKDWKAQVDQPGFKDALTFYADTLKASGESDPVSAGFTECLNLFGQGKAAMWYDATSAAGSLESPDLSKVVGNVGYVAAPVVKTSASGWLWSWNLAVPNTSKHKDAAWKFINWATNKDYGTLVGKELGWSRVPPGARQSTYSLPEYQKAAAAFADITKESILAVNPAQPGVNPQPWVGIQYVTIPEWQDLGNQASQVFADVYAGRETVDGALTKVQTLAKKAGDAQK